MELMKHLSLDADPGCAKPEIDIIQELATAEAQWQKEVCLPSDVQGLA
jgi:hypothetical protein